MDPLQVDGAYYALPYNPYGTRENYNWSFPARWFDMKQDEVVLIGDEFWKRLDAWVLTKLLSAPLTKVGIEYKTRNI